MLQPMGISPGDDRPIGPVPQAGSNRTSRLRMPAVTRLAPTRFPTLLKASVVVIAALAALAI